MTRIIALLFSVAALSAFVILLPIGTASAGVSYLPQFPRAENNSIFCSDGQPRGVLQGTQCMRRAHLERPPADQDVHCQRDYQACLGRCGGDPRGPGHGD
jgi:hypothetical protein